jgi:hypothetical protein
MEKSLSFEEIKEHMDSYLPNLRNVLSSGQKQVTMH